jgi:hypothetical protein
MKEAVQAMAMPFTSSVVYRAFDKTAAMPAIAT